MGETLSLHDQLALLPVTRRFYASLEEGDIAEITRRSVKISCRQQHRRGSRSDRDIESNLQYDAGDKGIYRHYMQKEITRGAAGRDQNTLTGRISHGQVI